MQVGWQPKQFSTDRVRETGAVQAVPKHKANGRYASTRKLGTNMRL